MEYQQFSKLVYKNYCQAIALSTGKKGKALSDAIAEANRMSYRILFGTRDIRQSDMTEQQLDKLLEHRLAMTSAMLTKHTKSLLK